MANLEDDTIVFSLGANTTVAWPWKVSAYSLQHCSDLTPIQPVLPYCVGLAFHEAPSASMMLLGSNVLLGNLDTQAFWVPIIPWHCQICSEYFPFLKLTIHIPNSFLILLYWLLSVTFPPPFLLFLLSFILSFFCSPAVLDWNSWLLCPEQALNHEKLTPHSLLRLWPRNKQSVRTNQFSLW